MRKILLVGMTVLVIAVLTGCAAGPNSLAFEPSPEGELAGFWQGLWHGSISFITFIISLFNDNVNVYEVHNNGGWYNFGFIFGVMIAYGGGGRGSHRSRRK
jgi:hypothetical protein